MKKIAILLITIITLSSCSDDMLKADAYGNFEATEITVSSETNGKIVQFNLNEGDVIPIGKLVAQIDTIALLPLIPLPEINPGLVPDVERLFSFERTLAQGFCV